MWFFVRSIRKTFVGDMWGKKDEADLLVVVLQDEEGRAGIVGVEASLGSLRGDGKKMALFGLLI